MCKTPQHPINDVKEIQKTLFYRKQQQRQWKTSYKLVIEPCERMLESALTETSGCFVVCYIRLCVHSYSYCMGVRVFVCAWDVLGFIGMRIYKLPQGQIIIQIHNGYTRASVCQCGDANLNLNERERKAEREGERKRLCYYIERVFTFA